MKKQLCIILCLALLPFSALCEKAGVTAYIDGKTSDRVHLRKAASTKSASLGLFFTGTPVICYAAIDDVWTEVQIGAQKGYMMSEYLTSVDGGMFEMVGTVKNIKETTALRVRKTPSSDAAALCTIRLNDRVRVLGETKDKWCYVQVGAEYGYIKTQYLSMEDVWRAAKNAAGAPTIDLKDPYMPILHKYYLALLERWEWGKLLENDLCEMCDLGYAESNPLTEVGYMLEDMNDDGIKELLIGSLSDEYDQYMLFEMYILKDEKPISIVISWARSRNYLCKDKIINGEGSNGAASGEFDLMRLSSNNQLEYIEITRYEGDLMETEEYERENYSDTPYWKAKEYIEEYPYGTMISEKEFDANLARYASLRIQYPLTPFSTLQGSVGRIHVDGNISGNTTVNIRQKPEKRSKVLAAPQTGTTISVLSQKGDWYEVYCDGVHGYIMAEYVLVY